VHRLTLIIIFIFFSTGLSVAGIDSLKSLLAADPPVNEKIKILNQLAFEYRQSNYLLSEGYGQEALMLSVKVGNKEGVALAHYRLGLNYWLHAFYPEALAAFHQAENAFSDLGLSSYLAAVSNNIGLVHLYRADYDSALVYLETSLNLFTALKDTSKMATQSRNIGLVYDHLGNFHEATKHNVQALKYKLSFSSIRDLVHRDESNDAIRLTKHLRQQYLPQASNSFQKNLARADSAGLAETSSYIGTLYFLEDNYDSAIYYFHLAFGIYEKLKEPDYYVLQWMDLARCHRGKGQLDSAIYYFNKAIPVLLSRYMHASADGTMYDLGNLLLKKKSLEKAEEIFNEGVNMADTMPHPASSVRFRLALFEVYLAKNDLLKANSVIDEAYDRAQQIRNFSLIIECANKFYQIHKLLKNDAEALKYHEEYLLLSEKKQVALKERELLEIQVNYESEILAGQITQLNAMNQHKTNELEKNRRLLFVIVGIVGALIFLAVFLVNRIRKVVFLSKNIKENNLLLDRRNKEKDTLIQEVHHRVKNNLQLISSIFNMQIRRTENKKAKQILESTQSRVKSIALIHEHLYQKEQMAVVNFSEYITELANHIRQSFVFPNVDPKLELNIDSIYIPMDIAIQLGVMLNELIVNSFKYAFKNHESPVFSITGKHVEPKLSISIKDNGKPNGCFKPGYGWALINNTIQNLNGKVSLNTDDGYLVTIEIDDYFMKDYEHQGIDH